MLSLASAVEVLVGVCRHDFLEVNSVALELFGV